MDFRKTRGVRTKLAGLSARREPSRRTGQGMEERTHDGCGQPPWASHRLSGGPVIPWRGWVPPEPASVSPGGENANASWGRQQVPLWTGLAERNNVAGPAKRSWALRGRNLMRNSWPTVSRCSQARTRYRPIAGFFLSDCRQIAGKKSAREDRSSLRLRNAEPKEAKRMDKGYGPRGQDRLFPSLRG